MLLQSHGGEVRLLPALPSAWPSGSVRGLRARGGFELDLVWSEGALQSVTLRAVSGTTCRLVYGDEGRDIDLEIGEQIHLDADLDEIR